jgi:hypothetical protein
MLKYLLKNSDAGMNLTSYKAPTEILKNGKSFYINSMELIWSVAGTTDAEIEIIISNEKYSDSIVKNITIDTADNRTNTKLIKLYPLGEFISVNYRHNSVTSGSVTVCVNYSGSHSVQSIDSVTFPDISG